MMSIPSGMPEAPRTSGRSANTDGRRPLVSVVTPFFNTDAHLAQCIRSVLNQSYDNFEYILVDNCSTDGSVAIVEEFAKHDSRIKLYHTDRFLTQLQNYNRALRLISAESTYVKMVQADDAIFPRCLEEMTSLAEANPTVGVVSSYRILGSSLAPSGVPIERTIMSGREACRRALMGEYTAFGSLTTVLMRADLVRQRECFYPEDRLFADSVAMFEVLKDVDFGFVHQVLSFSRVEGDSISGRMATYAPMLLDRTIRLSLFGQEYLTADEYKRCVKEQERAHARFLAEAWLRRREPELWDLHRRGLETIGRRLEEAWGPRDVLAVALHYASSPHLLIAAMSRRMRRLFSSAKLGVSGADGLLLPPS
jgi:glycosyltransferase involved in cell wall biosynthesis